MIKLWLYLIIFAVFCGLGIAIGSANSSVVTFDFLILKKEVSLGTVLVIGALFGMILGIYMSLLFCFKVWAKSLHSKSELKKELKKAKAAANSNKLTPVETDKKQGTIA